LNISACMPRCVWLCAIFCYLILFFYCQTLS